MYKGVVKIVGRAEVLGRKKVRSEKQEGKKNVRKAQKGCPFWPRFFGFGFCKSLLCKRLGGN
jgi:hypothetical protein